MLSVYKKVQDGFFSADLQSEHIVTQVMASRACGFDRLFRAQVPNPGPGLPSVFTRLNVFIPALTYPRKARQGVVQDRSYKPRI